MSPVDEAQPLSAEEIAAIRERLSRWELEGEPLWKDWMPDDLATALTAIAERDARIAELEARLAEWIDTERVSS